MHVDTSLPLWALFDVYGTVQKVKLLGSCSNRSLLPFYLTAAIGSFSYCLEFHACDCSSQLVLFIKNNVFFCSVSAKNCGRDK